MSETGF